MRQFLRIFDTRMIGCGVVMGVVPALLNHLSEFVKWSLFARTASEWGFWVIFVSLIVAVSKTRMRAVVNVVIFCLVMMVTYGLVEALFSSSGLAYFVEYERGQLFWYVITIVLVPVAAVIWGSLQKKSRIVQKIIGVCLVVLPLLYAAYEMASMLRSEVVVCANIAAGWRADVCTLQQPDAWIMGNEIVTIALYVGFALWWLYVVWQRNVMRKSTTAHVTSRVS